MKQRTKKDQDSSEIKFRHEILGPHTKSWPWQTQTENIVAQVSSKLRILSGKFLLSDFLHFLRLKVYKRKKFCVNKTKASQNNSKQFYHSKWLRIFSPGNCENIHLKQLDIPLSPIR